MRWLLALLALSACTPLPFYEIVGCPASDGWSAVDRERLLWERIQPEFKKKYPYAAHALDEYSDANPDRCILLSGLREYP